MKIQLALDRLTINQAIALTNKVVDFVDVIEVGTSLIKEFGMGSVSELKQAFPTKQILADIKTIDNARYELELCYQAGADITTVMGSAHPLTIEQCIQFAQANNKDLMIDLLNLNAHQKEQLFANADDHLYFCEHISKDEQELGIPRKKTFSRRDDKLRRIAIAGGITIQTLPQYIQQQPNIIIVGSAITQADDPVEVAKELSKHIRGADHE